MIQTATTPKPAKSLWLTFLPAWVLANVVGWGLMYLIGLQHPDSLVAMSGAALLISTLQWLCLRSFLHADYLWIAVSTITYGAFVWVLSSSGSESSLIILLMVVVSLFGLGWLQSWHLKSFVNRATAWPLVSSLAAPLAILVGLAIFPILAGLSTALLSTTFASTLFWAIFGAVYGGIMGALLVLLKSATKARAAADDSIPRWKRAEK